MQYYRSLDVIASPISVGPRTTSLMFEMVSFESGVAFGKIDSISRIQFIRCASIPIDFLEATNRIAHLTQLGISYCGLTSIEFLRGNTAIVKLDISHNMITSLDPLRDNRALVVLRACYNNITDLSPIEDNRTLKSVYVAGNPIHSLAPFKGNRVIEELRIIDCGGIIDLSPLDECSSLRSLGICETPITNLSPLKNLPIERISFSGCTIEDLSPLANPHLKFVMGQNTSITSFGIDFLRRCPNISDINLSIRNLEDISALGGNESIERLTISGNMNVSSFPRLGKESKLLFLDLSQTRITDFAFVEDLKHIKSLTTTTVVKDITPFLKNASIEWVLAEYKSAADAELMNRLTRMNTLNSTNRETTLFDLIHNPGIPHL